MPATLEAVRARIVADLGYIEGPPPRHDGNVTKFGAWYGLDGQPWCAMAISKWFYDAGLPLPASTSKGFAWCPAGAEWFQRAGRWGAEPREGAVVFFRFGARIDHVGWVDKVITVDGQLVPATIEANTSPGDGGSQTNGGGVYRRVRRSNVAGYGYPAYAPSTPPTSPGGFPMGLTDAEQRKLVADVADIKARMAGLSTWVHVDDIKELTKGKGKASINVIPGGFVRIAKNSAGPVTLHGQWSRADGTQDPPGVVTLTEAVTDHTVRPTGQDESPPLTVTYWVDGGEVDIDSWATT